ncbi:AbrB/MazE/SpoVT family DNA-binding domain-containing protein [Prosthecochloris sp. SCSIO W1101]|uniref:AbrB/MazE/SpoVT family DNA-binding domain-containing protein n=1 Tax=Prosthecochloris sp. SCSIO W1101 TaxID=2992242 RepID=UPI0039FD310E
MRVRQKNQITIPHRIAEEADIKPDDVLEITYINDVVTIVPAGKKGNKRSVMEYAGVAKGTWGKTTSTITKTTSLK